MDKAVIAGSPRFSRLARSCFATGAAVASFVLVTFALSTPAIGKSRITFPYSPCTAKSTLPACVAKRLGTELVPYTPRPIPIMASPTP